MENTPDEEVDDEQHVVNTPYSNIKFLNVQPDDEAQNEEIKLEIDNSKDVPPEVKDFDPPLEAEFFLMEKGVKYRRIFGEPMVFSEEEEALINEFVKYLDKNKYKLPHTMTIRDAYRHLIVIKDHKETYESVWAQYNFFLRVRPVKTDNLEMLMDSGIFYFCNRDKYHRPICVLNLKKFCTLKYTDDELERFTVLMFDYVVERCMVPGKIENMIVLVDAKDVGVTQIPRKKLRPLTNTMKT